MYMNSLNILSTFLFCTKIASNLKASANKHKLLLSQPGFVFESVCYKITLQLFHTNILTHAYFASDN